MLAIMSEQYNNYVTVSYLKVENKVKNSQAPAGLGMPKDALTCRVLNTL